MPSYYLTCPSIICYIRTNENAGKLNLMWSALLMTSLIKVTWVAYLCGWVICPPPPSHNKIIGIHFHIYMCTHTCICVLQKLYMCMFIICIITTLVVHYMNRPRIQGKPLIEHTQTMPYNSLILYIVIKNLLWHPFMLFRCPRNY